jgi:hypothetical protein
VKNNDDLSVMLVKKKKKNLSHDMVYKLFKMVLILSVATASVERVFSSMNYVNNKLKNKTGEQFLNNCLVTFLKCGFFLHVQNDDIVARFQKGETVEFNNIFFLCYLIIGDVVTSMHYLYFR